jgi:hypothetical protein
MKTVDFAANQIHRAAAIGWGRFEGSTKSNLNSNARTQERANTAPSKRYPLILFLISFPLRLESGSDMEDIYFSLDCIQW